MNEPPIVEPADEKRHRAAERYYWKRQLRLNHWLNWITGGAAFVALFGLVILFGQMLVMRGQLAEMQAEQRPWIAVSGIWHSRAEPLKIGAPFQYMIEFANVGVSPAQEISWTVKPRFIALRERSVDASQISGENICAAPLTQRLGDVIFPERERSIYQPSIGYIPPAFIGVPVTVTPGMIAGDTMLIVQGCIKYGTTGGEVGQTQFCYLIQPDARSPLGPGSVNSIECGKGNFAR